MTAKKSSKIAIVIGRRFTPGEALAMIIATTAATYAFDHYDEFNTWLKNYQEKYQTIENEEISRELLMAAIERMIAIMPREL